MRIKLRCSHNCTHNEMADFMKSSVYTPASRILSILGGDEHCQVYLPQLDHEKIDLKWVIPNIRYCRRATIDECPKRYGFPLDAAFARATLKSYGQEMDGSSRTLIVQSATE
jgi:hypothetical protein